MWDENKMGVGWRSMRAALCVFVLGFCMRYMGLLHNLGGPLVTRQTPWFFWLFLFVFVVWVKIDGFYMSFLRAFRCAFIGAALRSFRSWMLGIWPFPSDGSLLRAFLSWEVHRFAPSNNTSRHSAVVSFRGGTILRTTRPRMDSILYIYIKTTNEGPLTQN